LGNLQAQHSDVQPQDILLLRIDTPIEVDYYRAGGILPFVLKELVSR